MKKDGGTERDSNKSPERRINLGELAPESGGTIGTGSRESEPIGDGLADILNGIDSTQGNFDASGNASDGNIGETNADTERSGGDSGGAVKRGRGRPRGSGKRDGNNRSGRDTTRGSTGAPASEEESDTDLHVEIPGKVDFDNLLKFPKGKTRPANPQTTLAKLLSTAYKIPYHMGFGEHWPLDSEEAKDFAQGLLDVKSTLTKSQQVWLEKILKEYAPLVALVGIMYAINAPRIFETKRLYEFRKLAQSQTNAGNVFPRATEQSENVGPENSGESTKATQFARNLKSSFASSVAGNV